MSELETKTNFMHIVFPYVIASSVLSGCAGQLDLGSTFTQNNEKSMTHSRKPRSIAFYELSGVPQDVAKSLSTPMANAAKQHRIAVYPTHDVNAVYHVKGYVDASPNTEGTTDIAYVWDIYDQNNQVVKRLTGQVPAQKANEDNPWQGVNETDLTSFARESVARISSWLSVE